MTLRITALKLRRMEKGLLQLEVSRVTGIDRSRLSLIENGWCEPNAVERSRIAAALGVPVESLSDEVRAA